MPAAELLTKYEDAKRPAAGCERPAVGCCPLNPQDGLIKILEISLCLLYKNESADIIIKIICIQNVRRKML